MVLLVCCQTDLTSLHTLVVVNGMWVVCIDSAKVSFFMGLHAELSYATAGTRLYSDRKKHNNKEFETVGGGQDASSTPCMLHMLGVCSWRS